MISHIRGKIAKRKNSSIIIDVDGGFSYEVLIPGCVMSALDKSVNPDGTIKLITYHYHHTDPAKSIPVLIGFLNEIEKEFFEKFITVSGIGPKAAVKALNASIPKIVKAIADGDLTTLKSLPGIGEQRAKEIVAKLQNKVGKFGLIQEYGVEISVAEMPNFQEEAMDVLLQLQYKKPEAKEMIQKALERSPGIKTAEDLLNEVYKQKKSR
ncbi:MAG: Holliday junction branch migration protein RuvA [Candidatus Omnitrophota bacterium]|nr:Holliday junction branch migration protein RuvA [Candidatus Omnitrophota bacterium]